jgi:hypothetical protein
VNRETWLLKAVDLLRPTFKLAGYDIPATVHVSVGFPSKGALRAKGSKVLGECWKPKVSADGNSQIYINPLIADGSRVLDVLIHELIHAVLPEAGHKKPFAAAAVKLGLDGPPKATVASEALKRELDDLIARELGTYPHPALSPVVLEKKQSTRLIKAVCATPACAGDAEGDVYTVRITRKWLDKFGAPLCPNCEAVLVPDDKQVAALNGD